MFLSDAAAEDNAAGDVVADDAGAGVAAGIGNGVAAAGIGNGVAAGNPKSARNGDFAASSGSTGNVDPGAGAPAADARADEVMGEEAASTERGTPDGEAAGSAGTPDVGTAGSFPACLRAARLFPADLPPAVLLWGVRSSAVQLWAVRSSAVLLWAVQSSAGLLSAWLGAARSAADDGIARDRASPARTDAAPRAERLGPSIRTAVLKTLLVPFS